MIIKGGKFRQPKAQKKFQKEIEKKGGIYIIKQKNCYADIFEDT